MLSTYKELQSRKKDWFKSSYKEMGQVLSYGEWEWRNESPCGEEKGKERHWGEMRKIGRIKYKGDREVRVSDGERAHVEAWWLEKAQGIQGTKSSFI